MANRSVGCYRRTAQHTIDAIVEVQRVNRIFVRAAQHCLNERQALFLRTFLSRYDGRSISSTTAYMADEQSDWDRS